MEYYYLGFAVIILIILIYLLTPPGREVYLNLHYITTNDKNKSIDIFIKSGDEYIHTDWNNSFIITIDKASNNLTTENKLKTIIYKFEENDTFDVIYNQFNDIINDENIDLIIVYILNKINDLNRIKNISKYFGKLGDNYFNIIRRHYTNKKEDYEILYENPNFENYQKKIYI